MHDREIAQRRGTFDSELLGRFTTAVHTNPVLWKSHFTARRAQRSQQRDLIVVVHLPASDSRANLGRNVHSLCLGRHDCSLSLNFKTSGEIGNEWGRGADWTPVE